MNAPLFGAGALLAFVGVAHLVSPERMSVLRHWPGGMDEPRATESELRLWRGLGAVLVFTGVVTMGVAL